MVTTTRVLTASVNGTVYTSNLNGALEAVDTCHAGATAPTDEVSNGKFWLDTSVTPSVLKVRADGAWVVVGTGQSLTASTDLSVNSIGTSGGSAASPSHTFTSDPDTGMFRTGANGLGFSTGGVQRMDIGSSGMNLPAVSTETAEINIGNGRSGDGASRIDLVGDATYTDFGLRLVRYGGANALAQIIHKGTGNLAFTASEASNIIFQTTNTTRLTIGSGGAATFTGNIISEARMVSADGSAGSPAYSFTNDTDTGIYLGGTNTIGFAAGGSERLRITPTQFVVSGSLVLNGTAITSTGAELNYVDGVTSNIQTQLDNVIGVGQQWYNDGAIVAGTVYTNSFSRPVQVQVSLQGTGSKTLGLSHNGTTWVESLDMNNDSDDSDVNTSFIVPAGHRWRITGAFTSSRRLTLR